MNTDFVESGHIEGSDIIGGKIGIGDYQADGTYKFQVDEDGTMHAHNGTFSGTIEAAKITAANININNGVFSVTPNGFMTATSGNIGGWEINGNTLSKNNIVFDSSGSVYCNDPNNPTRKIWEIKANGDADFTNCSSFYTSSDNVLIDYNNRTYNGYSSWIYTPSSDSQTAHGVLLDNLIVTQSITAQNMIINELSSVNAMIDDFKTNYLNVDTMTLTNAEIKNIIGLDKGTPLPMYKGDTDVSNYKSYNDAWESYVEAGSITADMIVCTDAIVKHIDKVGIIDAAKKKINTKTLIRAKSFSTDYLYAKSDGTLEVNRKYYSPQSVGNKIVFAE